MFKSLQNMSFEVLVNPHHLEEGEVVTRFA